MVAKRNCVKRGKKTARPKQATKVVPAPNREEKPQAISHPIMIFSCDVVW